MTPDPDWRLQGQQSFLLRARLARRRYSPPRPDRDHDHCEFCGAKFMAVDAPDVLREGYVTLQGERWICETCFADFRARFDWELQDDGPARPQ